jgi:hypothetical protein
MLGMFTAKEPVDRGQITPYLDGDTNERIQNGIKGVAHLESPGQEARHSSSQASVTIHTPYVKEFRGRSCDPTLANRLLRTLQPMFGLKQAHQGSEPHPEFRLSHLDFACASI